MTRGHGGNRFVASMKYWAWQPCVPGKIAQWLTIVVNYSRRFESHPSKYACDFLFSQNSVKVLSIKC